MKREIKIAIVSILIGIIITILSIIYGPIIYNHFWGKEGIQTIPSEIFFNCDGMGKIKTITLTNYDDIPQYDVPLTLSWSLENNASIVLLRDPSNAIRAEINSIVTKTLDDNFMHFTDFVTVIKPKESLTFDFKISADCKKDFVIYINKYSPIESRGEVFS